MAIFASASLRIAAIAAALAFAVPAFGATDDLAARRAESQAEFERVSLEISVSRERMAALVSEIAGLKKDNATITAALIQAAKTEKKLSEEISDIAERLDRLGIEAAHARQELIAQRASLAEVLGALQRMGLHPPPAILVTPEDALSSVRSAILLGAAVPQMREETQALARQMERVERLRASIDAERERLAGTVAEQAAEKQRLVLLQEEKAALQDRSQSALADERRRATELASKAGSLNKLIAALEAEAKRKDAEDARRADLEAAAAARPAVPSRGNLMAGSAAFADMRGRLALPAFGRVVYRFGEPDGTGGARQGDTVTTQSGAIVTAPSDARVLYAGPFRSYGQVLILNAGDGYLVLLAGMDGISVGPDQAVLAGEPIGTMGEMKVASASGFAEGSAGPELYVEFRKDGKPIDPSPWWAERLSGRTANGT
jgi:murein hydrolase activator